ncbi:putative proton-dependent oligopeptide transporter family [Helianthus anomalus]
MVAAALIELKRLHVAQSHGLVDDPRMWFHAFTYIGQLDFFLRECPKGMKKMSTGLFSSTLSFGFFFSSLLVTIVHNVTGDSDPWLADNLNNGKLYNFYESIHPSRLAPFLPESDSTTLAILRSLFLGSPIVPQSPTTTIIFVIRGRNQILNKSHGQLITQRVIPNPPVFI